MRRLVIVFIFILLGLQLPGQINRYGVPVIRNYNTQVTPGSEQNWCITKDNFGNLYFGNQDRGIIKYDGTNWSQIQLGNNPRVFSLASDSRGIVYVGAAFEFGYIQPDSKGKPEYISLSSRIDSIPEIRVVYSIVVLENKVLFQSPKFTYVYDILKDTLTKIELKKFGILDALRLIKINDKLIIADNVTGLHELKDSIILPLPGGDFFAKKNCTVILPFTDSKVLIGTFFDGLFIYDYKTGAVNKNFIEDKLNEKIKEVSIYAAAVLKDGLFAIGTTNELGILIFNKSGELVQQIKNENSGLADNTIIAMYCDPEKNSELWISTQGYISKVYVNLPLTYFSEKQGIQSGLNSIAEFNGSIYLGHDAGVYKNSRNKQNEEVFSEVPGLNSQVFPLERIQSNQDFLLAGSLNGVYQISNKDVVRKIEQLCTNLPSKIFKFNAKTILQSRINPSEVFLGLDAGGIVLMKFDGQHWIFVSQFGKISGTVAGIVEKKEGGLWFITDDPIGLYSAVFNKTDTIITKYGIEKGVPDADIVSIKYIGKELYITTTLGLMRYEAATDKFIFDNSLTGNFSEKRSSSHLFSDPDGDLWYSGIDKNVAEVLFRKENNKLVKYDGIFRILPNVPQMDLMYSDGKIYMLKSKSVYVIDKSKIVQDTSGVNTAFVRIVAGTDSVVMEGSFYRMIENNKRIPVITNTEKAIPEFGFDMNEMSFEWTTPSYTEELFTEYSYKLEGFDNDWSEWEGISFGNTMVAQYSKKEYSNLPYGTYKFIVRTRTLTGQTGNELSYDFIILKPWYATIAAFIGFILIAILIIIAIIKAYTKKLKNENIRLEGIVAERTAVVVKQKEELESSIHYASRIQMALLPSEAILSENIKNYFVLFKPRDIVSGDFYWMTKKGERLYIVAADCTGHGVPGAFMSLLGMSFLDEIIDKALAPRADEILRELRLHVTESLKQVGGDDEAKDGMDMGLLVIDFARQRVEFSGAYNPCFRVRKLTEDEITRYANDESEMADGSMSNGKYLLETIYASKMPIGISSRMKEEFVFYDWALEKGVSYYMSSDGYIDQFGGPNGRKFMKKNFKRFILELQGNSMEKQRDLLDANLLEWRGQGPQIDDILVMGIRIE
jgi:hypothetical protein